jgi:ATP-dependent helicase/DNAse subunit B
MILDDPESISAMGLRYTPVYSSSHPDEIRDTKRKFLYDEEGWQSLMEQVEKSVITAADGIRSGEIPAKPKEQKGKSPCEYCEFKPICRKA